jgi:hypothetical protein
MSTFSGFSHEPSSIQREELTRSSITVELAEKGSVTTFRSNDNNDMLSFVKVSVNDKQKAKVGYWGFDNQLDNIEKFLDDVGKDYVDSGKKAQAENTYDPTVPRPAMVTGAITLAKCEIQEQKQKP